MAQKAEIGRKNGASRTLCSKSAMKLELGERKIELFEDAKILPSSGRFKASKKLKLWKYRSQVELHA